jgi:hypothetical protein
VCASAILMRNVSGKDLRRSPTVKTRCGPIGGSTRGHSQWTAFV